MSSDTPVQHFARSGHASQSRFEAWQKQCAPSCTCQWCGAVCRWDRYGVRGPCHLSQMKAERLKLEDAILSICSTPIPGCGPDPRRTFQSAAQSPDRV